MSAEYRRRYRLGSGVAVEFVFLPDQYRKGQVCMKALVCEWDPCIPQLPPGNARNKLERRYRAARDDFYQDIAQLLGGNLLNVDLDEHGRPGEMTTFTPQVPS